MPRKSRIYLARISSHVVQLHAYCLMTNHVNLLMTQERSNIGISQIMQHVGRSYVAYVNKTYRRSEAL